MNTNQAAAGILTAMVAPAATPDQRKANRMKARHVIVVAATTAVLSLVSGCATADVAYAPYPDADYAMSRHPNIEAASYNAQQAIDRMQAAQHANHDALGGHAGRTIQLLRDAQSEMQAAAIAATHY